MDFTRRLHLGEQLFLKKALGHTNAELSAEFNLDERRIREYVALFKAHNGIGTTNTSAPESLYQEPAYEAKVAKTNLIEVTNTLRDWTRQRSTVKLAYPTDIHFPFHDKKACDLFLNMVEVFEPDVIIDGSDVFDFPNISKHYTGTKAKTFDAWSVSKPMYQQWRNVLTKRVPKAKAYFIPGNHDTRMLDWAANEMPQFGNTLEREFIDTITDAGSLWLGRDTDLLQLGPLLVIHGDRTGKNAAEQTWRNVGFPHEATIAGHIHATQRFNRTTVVNNEWHMSTTHISGCLCDIRPSWNHKLSGFSWDLGFIFATIDFRNKHVDVENIVVNPARYTAMWGGKVWK